jgi:hypothetical protein
MVKVSDSVFVFGGDTLKMNPWLQDGNWFGTIGSFGTMDDNPIDFYTNGLKRGRWWNTIGNLIIGNASDNGYPLQLYGKGNLSFYPTLSRPTDVNLNRGPMYKIKSFQDNSWAFTASLFGTFQVVKDNLRQAIYSGAAKRLSEADYRRCFMMMNEMAKKITSTGGRLVILDSGQLQLVL